MKKTAVLLVILAGILWGTSAIFSKLLSPMGYAPVQMTAMRSIVSALCLFLYIFFSDRGLFKTSLKQLALYVLSGFATFGAAFFYYESIKNASVSVAVMLMYTAPVFVIIYSVAFLSEKLPLSKLLSILVMLFGCALVTGIFGTVSFSTWGICSGLLAGISYGAYNIIAKIEMNKGCNPITASFYSFFVMALISFVIGDIPGIFNLAALSPLKSYLLIIGIGVCTMSLPYFLYTVGLKYIPAGTASALGILEPVMATVFAVVFFDDYIDIYVVLGIIMVLISVLILSRSKN